MPVKAWLCLILSLQLLAGCASQAPKDPARQNWEEHHAQLEQLSRWIATGKLALHTTERSEAASMLWQQDGENTRLQLSGPIGFNAMIVTSDGRSMAMRQGDTVRAWDISSPGAIARATGWDLPLQALPYWLRGMPFPGMAVQSLEIAPDTALLQALRQDDWDVLYEKYGQFDTTSLPTRLRIQRGDTSAKVIIRDWKTPDA